MARPIFFSRAEIFCSIVTVILSMLIAAGTPRIARRSVHCCKKLISLDPSPLDRTVERLFGPQISALYLGLFMGWRTPLESSAMGVNIHPVPQRYRRSIFQDDAMCLPKKLFPFFDIEGHLLQIENLIELGITVAKHTLGHSGSEVLLK